MFNLIVTQFKSEWNWRNIVLINVLILGLVALFSLTFDSLEGEYLARQQLHIGIVNQDDNPMMGILLDSFQHNANFTSLFAIKQDNSAAISQAFQDQQLDAYIIIPEGFSEGVLGYEESQLTIMTHSGFPTQRLLLKEIFEAYKNYIRLANSATITLYRELDPTQFDTGMRQEINRQFSLEIIQATMARQHLFVTERLDYSAGVSSSGYFLLALGSSLLAFSLIPSAVSSYQNIQSTVHQRLFASGISNMKYLLAMHVVSFMQAGITILLLVIGAALFSQLNIAVLMVSYLSMTFFWSVLWLLLALLVNNQSRFISLAFAVAILIAISGGAFTPFTILPQQIKFFNAYTPIYASLSFALTPTFNRLLGLLLWIILAVVGLFVEKYLLRRLRLRR